MDDNILELDSLHMCNFKYWLSSNFSNVGWHMLSSQLQGWNAHLGTNLYGRRQVVFKNPRDRTWFQLHWGYEDPQDLKLRRAGIVI